MLLNSIDNHISHITFQYYKSVIVVPNYFIIEVPHYYILFIFHLIYIIILIVCCSNFEVHCCLYYIIILPIQYYLAFTFFVKPLYSHLLVNQHISLFNLYFKFLF